MQAQACATIKLCLTDQIMYHVMDESSPKKIWDKLVEYPLHLASAILLETLQELCPEVLLGPQICL